MQTIDYAHDAMFDKQPTVYNPHHYNLNHMENTLKYITEYFKYYLDISHNTSDITQTYHKIFQISL